MNRSSELNKTQNGKAVFIKRCHHSLMEHSSIFGWKSIDQVNGLEPSGFPQHCLERFVQSGLPSCRWWWMQWQVRKPWVFVVCVLGSPPSMHTPSLDSLELSMTQNRSTCEFDHTSWKRLHRSDFGELRQVALKDLTHKKIPSLLKEAGWRPSTEMCLISAE